MNSVIPLHQYQYKYKKYLEIKKANKKTKSNKDININKISDTAHPLKYSNDSFSNKKNNEKLKINYEKKIGNTDYKRSGLKNNNINNYYNNIYKKQALFRNEHQNIKLKKEQICKNNNKIFDLKNDNNDNNPITEVKNSINKNIVNNAENKVSDFTLREKLSYSEQHKIRKNHYLEKNLNNSMNNIHISNPSLKDINNNNSSFQYKSNSGQKLNLSYLAFIKDFKAKYNEDTNLKNKKKRTYVPYLSKFLNTNIPPTLQICNEMIISIISSLEQKEIIDNNINKNDDEIINNIKNELDIKDNKIKELFEKIEVQKNEYIQLNNKYNDMISENQKLKEEISNLKKELNDNKIEIPNIDNIDDINKNNIIKKESPKYNNLITYNINKNNNFNIINSEINNFNNIIQNTDNNNNDIQQQKEEEKEKEQSNKEKNSKEDKKSRALERLKKKQNKKEPEVKKSNKIAEMAKMLEMQMKGDNNEKEEVIEKDGNNNNIVDLINSQIIINKKKKKGKKILFNE